MAEEIAEYSCFLGIADYKGSPQVVFVKTAKLVLVYEKHNIFCIEDVVAIDLRAGVIQNTFTTCLTKVISI